MIKNNKVKIILVVLTLVISGLAGYVLGNMSTYDIESDDEKSAFELLEEIPERLNNKEVNE